ncbi:prion-like-(Q/N-rich) domain-bearing protein 25 isoform X1 [Tenebrio molitor]|uniref:prion-like-(Q/N-rich) domain-bearing protein 25 isoform X1 n=1 Tax=Tenebrio molitor TaxID=7067 RepID=UPI003624721F
MLAMYGIKLFSIVFLTLFVTINSQKLEEQNIQSYAPCLNDQDCKKNSFCYNNDDDVLGKCKCLKGFDIIRNDTSYECIVGARLEEACQKDIQCTITAGPLAICDEYKVCGCENESTGKDGICYKKMKLGEKCSHDNNCYLSDGSYGFCVLGVCSCRNDQKPSADKTLCGNAMKLGEPCTNDEECNTVPNTRCLEKCRCSVEYTMSKNQSSCVKAATKFDEFCEFDGQCSKFLEESICDSQKCTCSSDFHDYGNKCVETRKIGQSCEEDAECIYEKKLKDNVQCSSKKCTCIFGTKDDGSCNIEKTVDDNSSADRSTLIVCSNILFVIIYIII